MHRVIEFYHGCRGSKILADVLLRPSTFHYLSQVFTNISVMIYDTSRITNVSLFLRIVHRNISEVLRTFVI